MYLKVRVTISVSTQFPLQRALGLLDLVDLVGLVNLVGLVDLVVHPPFLAFVAPF